VTETPSRQRLLGIGAIGGRVHHRLAGSIRARLAILIVCAAAPLLVLAILIAWQNYTLRAGFPLGRAAVIATLGAKQVRGMLGAMPLDADADGRIGDTVLRALEWPQLVRDLSLASGNPDATSVWLLDRRGIPYADSGDDRGARAWLPEFPLPPLAELGTGEEGWQQRGRARDGTRFAYAARAIGGGSSILVGYRAERATAEARDLLMGRIGEFTLVLAACVAAVSFGASRMIADPVKHLARTVEQWRGGGGFTPGDIAGAPREVLDLSHSFALATSRLEAREAELRDALQQQELLMQEIHHRVKNNLQIVASLLNLQASRIRVPAARAEFQSARDRVRALATVHRHLYAQGELHTIDMREFLIELCGQLFQAMGETEGARIRLDIQALALKMSSDQAVPLSMIVTEAVSNAVKYAFPGGRTGRIGVHLTADEETATLVVEDDGVGIPGGQGESETGPRDGLGIQLIRGFARQLGARLEVEQGGDFVGTRYVVVLPLRRVRRASEEAADHEGDADPAETERAPAG
jgi:two-component sensor histidine kinase